MKRVLLFLLALSSSALSHPNGVYELDQNPEAFVEFTFIERCTGEGDSLKGGVRWLEFSGTAQNPPYNFISGYFVEQHSSEGEVYYETDQDCVLADSGQTIQATRHQFGGFSMRRIR